MLNAFFRSAFGLLRQLSLLLLLGLALRGQTFTNDVIDYGDGSSNVFSALDIGPDGKFYVLWKDGNFVQSVTNTTPRIKLLRRDTNAWTAIGTIIANTATIPNMFVNVPPEAFTMLGDGLGMKVDSQGHYHIVFQPFLKPASTTMASIMYGFSSNGTSWTFTKIRDNGGTTNYSFSDPAIDLDQNGRPHIVFRGSNASVEATLRPTWIEHHAFDGTSWSGGTVYERIGTSNAINNGVGFALDSAGKAHISIPVESNGSGTDASLYYLTNASGSWAAPVNLAPGSSNAAAVATSTSLAVDVNDKVHIVHRDHNASFKLYHHTNKSGSWVGGQVNGNLQGNVHLRSLTTNSGGDVVFVYNAQTSTTNNGAVRYACLFNGASTWQTGAVMTGNSATGQFFAAAFTSDRVAMFTFDHFTGSGSPSYGNPDNPRQLQYATATISPPGPSAPTLTSPTSASITGSGATLGGTVSADGGATITERGVVYAVTTTNSNPLIAGSGVTKVAGTGTTGLFTVAVSGLAAGTGYSYKAYATNSAGTSYTSVGTFTTVADSTAPTVVSIVRQNPSAQSLTANTAVFRVTFSESVTGVTTSTFGFEKISGDVAGSITAVSADSGATRDVTVTLSGGAGEFRLKVVN